MADIHLKEHITLTVTFTLEFDSDCKGTNCHNRIEIFLDIYVNSRTINIMLSYYLIVHRKSYRAQVSQRFGVT